MLITLNTLSQHRFPAHGELTVDWEGRFLHIQARGPFNLEMIEHAFRTIEKKAGPHWPSDGRMVELVQWHGSMLMPPDALELFNRQVDLWAARGFKSAHTLVMVEPGVEGRWPMLPKLVEMWGRSRPTEVFESLPPALLRTQALLTAFRPN